MLKHLYLAFWRPDIRDQLVSKGSPVVAMCDFVGNGESVITDTRDVTCPACRETFLQALPTGDGSKLTWTAYLASPVAAPRVTMAQRAAADAGWSTAPTPRPAVDPYLAGIQAKVTAPPPAWATTPPAKPDPGGWSTGKPGDGWTTKR